MFPHLLNHQDYSREMERVVRQLVSNSCQSNALTTWPDHHHHYQEHYSECVDVGVSALSAGANLLVTITPRYFTPKTEAVDEFHRLSWLILVSNLFFPFYLVAVRWSSACVWTSKTGRPHSQERHRVWVPTVPLIGNCAATRWCDSYLRNCARKYNLIYLQSLTMWKDPENVQHGAIGWRGVGRSAKPETDSPAGWNRQGE